MHNSTWFRSALCLHNTAQTVSKRIVILPIKILHFDVIFVDSWMCYRLL